MDKNNIQYCALPECRKPFNNWRTICCCRSHSGKYSAKLRHGTLNQPNKIIPNLSSPRKIKLTKDEKKAKWVTYVAARHRLVDLSMPVWANKDKILEFYKEARKLSKETGIKHEVDHIIPVRNPLVCGLHNEFNLQILTKSQNCQKSNKFEII